MITRMPPRTIDVWEQQRKVAVTPKLDELLEFLSGRARGRLHHDGVHEESHGGERYTHKKFDKEKPYASHESQNSEAARGTKRPAANGSANRDHKRSKTNDNGKKSAMNKGNDTRNAGSNALPPCKMCNGNHFLGRCNKFREVILSRRIQLLDQWHLCQVCLRPHGKGECKWKGCLRCNGHHHLMNCPIDAPQVNMLVQQKAAQDGDVDASTSA